MNTNYKKKLHTHVERKTHDVMEESGMLTAHDVSACFLHKYIGTFAFTALTNNHYRCTHKMDYEGFAQNGTQCDGILCRRKFQTRAARRKDELISLYIFHKIGQTTFFLQKGQYGYQKCRILRRFKI